MPLACALQVELYLKRLGVLRAEAGVGAAEHSSDEASEVRTCQATPGGVAFGCVLVKHACVLRVARSWPAIPGGHTCLLR